MTKLRLVVTFLALAALPIALAIVIVIVGGIAAGGSEYWTVAPWLVIAALVWTPGWMLIVAIGLTIYVLKRGIRKSALQHENLVIAAAIVVALACTYGPFAILNAKQQARFESADTDERIAVNFVWKNFVVVRQLESEFNVTTNYRGLEKDGSRRLVLAAYPRPPRDNGGVHVVVDIAETAAGRTPRIACIISREEYTGRAHEEDLCDASKPDKRR